MPKKKAKKKQSAPSQALRAARKELIKRIKRVGKERDELRALISDFQDLETSCSDAYESLESAIEALSRYA